MKSILNGRYEIIEEIGNGGMAQVYKARCNVLNRMVAVKVLKEEFTNDQDFIDKFKQESMSVAKLNHKNIVNVYDTGVDGNIYYIVMELISGITLNELIASEKRIGVAESVNIAIQICEALEHAHSNGVIHRDIKPHNILRDKRHHVKVADFGIARAVSNKTMTNNDSTFGSVNYFSPEQARGGYVDEKSDIYSFGIVLYEMLTGEVPFKGDSPISIALKHVNESVKAPSLINQEIPSKLDDIVLKCTNKKQSLRYADVTEIITDLKSINLSSIKETSKAIILNPEKEEALRRFLDNENDLKDNISHSDEGLLYKKRKKINKSQRKLNAVEDKSEVKEIKEEKNNFKYAALAVILALIITLVLSSFAVSYIKDYFSVKEVEVPNLIGVNVDDAKEIIETLGLKFEVKDRIYNSEFPKDQIINQNIKPGENLKEGFPIEVIVSEGERLIEIPDLTRKYSNEAFVILSEKGLKEGEITYEFSDTIPWGLVISQDPAAGTIAKEEDVVSYVLSKGPEIEYAIMPNLLGKTQSEAEEQILSKGFKIGEISFRESEEYEKDLVLYQSHPAETEVEKGTVVSLIISLGQAIEETTTEEPTGGSAQLRIELPTDKESMILIIERIWEENRQVIYQGKHYPEDSPIIIPVEGFGVQRFEIFIDSEYIGAEEIDFGN
ncbi:MAG: Stk1 family PASTA domain-containing Ser/Thr kinase [Tissierellales bacterium]|nr:Stk1 family PASTA domain-containing Ser/Thr kinase [Tissierellales bacterium]MBN2827696.1 Stk1 family PASTA domain-containing Ser/Thr kinase [Tissierellales bacterium]